MTDNKGTKPKGLTCTDVNLVQDECTSLVTGEAIELGEGQMCLQWPDRDNNICVGKCFSEISQ